MYNCFGLLWIKQFLYDYRYLTCGDATKSHPHTLFGNRMVVVHPSLSKGKGTRSANAFWDEGIVGFLTWREAAKDAILAAVAFTTVFSLLFRNWHIL